MPKIIQVIITENLRGNGTEGRPFYRVPQLFTLDGELICEAANSEFMDPKNPGHGDFRQLVNSDVLQSLMFSY